VPTSLFASFLVGTLGASAAILGLIEGLADGMAGIARLAGGALADDPVRRRRTAIGGYASTAVLSALIGAATAVWQVAFLRVAAWFSRGLRVPARNTLLADVVPASMYGRAYGFERAMDNFGAIVGPLLALLLVSLLGVRTAILLSVIPGLLAALAIIYAIRPIPQPTVREHQPLRIKVRPVLHGRLGKLLSGVAIFEVGNVAATLLILRATQLLTPTLGLNNATEVALFLYAGYNVAATLSSVPAGRVGDRSSMTLVLTIGVGLFMLAYLGFAVQFPSVVLLALSFSLAGIAIGCIGTSHHASVASLAPTELRGSAFGFLAAVQSFGNIVASGVAGLLWTLFSPTIAFLYLAAWMLISLVVLTRLAIRQDS
jgi:MFS family permease